MEAEELRGSGKPFEVVAEGPPYGKIVVTCDCNLMECVDNYTLYNLSVQGPNTMCYLSDLSIYKYNAQYKQSLTSNKNKR